MENVGGGAGAVRRSGFLRGALVLSSRVFLNLCFFVSSVLVYLSEKIEIKFLPQAKVVGVTPVENCA